MPRNWSVSYSTDAGIQRMRLTQPAKAEVNEISTPLRSGPNAEVDALELRGYPGIWRIRLDVGNRRLIYRANEERQTIEILDILRRDAAYEKYPIPDDEQL